MRYVLFGLAVSAQAYGSGFFSHLPPPPRWHVPLGSPMRAEQILATPSCLEPTASRTEPLSVIISQGEVHNIEENKLYSTLARFKASAGGFGFAVHLEQTAEKQHTMDRFSLTSSFVIKQITRLNTLSVHDIRLNDSALALKEENPALFDHQCGEGYVASKIFGTLLILTLKMEFATEKAKALFLAQTNLQGPAGLGPLVGGKFRYLMEKIKKETNLRLAFKALGAKPSFSEEKAFGDLPSCHLDDPKPCLLAYQNLKNHLYRYMADHSDRKGALLGFEGQPYPDIPPPADPLVQQKIRARLVSKLEQERLNERLLSYQSKEVKAKLSPLIKDHISFISQALDQCQKRPSHCASVEKSLLKLLTPLDLTPPKDPYAKGPGASYRVYHGWYQDPVRLQKDVLGQAMKLTPEVTQDELHVLNAGFYAQKGGLYRFKGDFSHSRGRLRVVLPLEQVLFDQWGERDSYEGQKGPAVGEITLPRGAFVELEFGILTSPRWGREARAELWYGIDEGPYQKISTPFLYPAPFRPEPSGLGPADGLRVQRFSDKGLQNRIQDIAISLPFYEPSGSPDERKHHYGLRMTGFLRLDQTDRYRFITHSDDGVRIDIANELILDAFDFCCGEKVSRPIELKKDTLYPITIDYWQEKGPAGLAVYFDSERHYSRQPLEEHFLYQKGAPP